MGVRTEPMTTPMQNQATPTAQSNARTLRREMTDAERRLWSRIRDEQLGVKFRRQHHLGSYIADFACLSPRLVIELDGTQHQQRQDYDSKRDAFFHAQGFKILRFPSNAPFLNLEGVLQSIANRLAELRIVAHMPPSLPSPRGGRSEKSRPPRGKEQITGVSS
jgi:very-short-patch-repair endonuclease